jgi:hypothetical protein
MNRIFTSMVAVLIGGAVAIGGCSTLGDTTAPAASGAGGYASEWGKTGPTGTPGELPPGVSSSGD